MARPVPGPFCRGLDDACLALVLTHGAVANPTLTLKLRAAAHQVPGPYCRDLDDAPQPKEDTKGAPKGAPPAAHAPKTEGGQKGAAKG